jgi:pimeloyl-ACP methyl ester carboxylesterase
MLPFVLVAAITFTLHDTDVLQPPKASPIADWTSQSSVSRETVEFTAKDGSHIRGWLYRAKPSDSSRDGTPTPTVLFFYGSNEDLVHEQARLAWLSQSLHVNAICFDYPGYGFSTGRVSVKATRDIALEEYDFISDHLAVQGSASAALPPTVSYGWSIGTGLAVHVAAERRVAGLILQAPPASAEEMAVWSSHHDVPRLVRGIAKVEIDAAVRPIYENVQEIAKVSSPLLVIQGTEDDVVPIAQGRKVFSASPAKQKTFVEVPGAHHNDIRVGHPPAGDAVATFLQQMEANDAPLPQTR